MGGLHSGRVANAHALHVHVARRPFEPTLTAGQPVVLEHDGPNGGVDDGEERAAVAALEVMPTLIRIDDGEVELG
jgi:hypothetical protein